MIGISIALLKIAGSVVLASAPQSPVALIADISGSPPGVHFMDYVEPGRVIRLGQKDSVVIGYMKSCWQETITGGTVTVGTEQSDVQGGQVERSRTPCDSGRMLLTAEHANVSAGA